MIKTTPENNKMIAPLKKSPRKLALRRETLRTLRQDDLREVAGARPPPTRAGSYCTC